MPDPIRQWFTVEIVRSVEFPLMADKPNASLYERTQDKTIYQQVFNELDVRALVEHLNKEPTP